MKHHLKFMSTNTRVHSLLLTVNRNKNEASSTTLFFFIEPRLKNKHMCTYMYMNMTHCPLHKPLDHVRSYWVLICNNNNALKKINKTVSVSNNLSEKFDEFFCLSEVRFLEKFTNF